MKSMMALFLVIAGCQQAKPFPDDDFSQLAGLDEKSDMFSNRLRLLGKLRSGVERSHHLDEEPRYRGYSFEAFTGERLEVTVKSGDADPVAWLTDAEFRVLKRNDDAADGATDSRIGYEVSDKLEWDPTLYVIWREYSDYAGHFRVRVQGDPQIRDSETGLPPTGCSTFDGEFAYGEHYENAAGESCVCSSDGRPDCH